MVNYIMEFLENDFAQVEHINQIIANNSNHESWDCFDTTYLLRQCPQLGYYDSANPENSYIIIPDGVKTVRAETVTSHNEIRYNSFIISIEKVVINNETCFQYTFEVRNSLWDGQYVISKTTKDANGDYEKFNEDEYVVDHGESEDDSSESGNVVIFTVKGNNKNSVRVCFHMTMAGATRNIAITKYQLILDSGLEFEHQYDTTNYEKGTVSLDRKGKLKNVTITIKPCNESGREVEHTSAIGAYIPEAKVVDSEIDKSNGEFNMPYGASSVPGVYYCLMEASSTSSDIGNAVQKIIKINKVQSETASIDWGDEDQYKNVWKGSKHKFRIKFNIKNKFGVTGEGGDNLIGKPITVVFKHMGNKEEQYTDLIKKDSVTDEYYVEVIISYRKYYDDFSYLVVELPSDYGFGRVTDQKLVKHPWFIAKSYNDVIGELYLTNSDGKYVDEDGAVIGNGLTTSSAISNDMGTDWIFMENKEYSVDRTLEINRELTIASLKGKTQCIFKGNNKNIIKTVPEDGETASNLMKVNIVGLTFKNAECAIYSNAGTRLLVERCYFTNNHHTNMHHKGCSVYIPDTDWGRKNHSLWVTEIRNSYFKNNKGNEIQSLGKMRIMGNLFITNSAEYLQQPEVKVVSVRAGNTSYLKNKSYINTGKKPMKSNHSFAKALTFVEKNATFNGKGPSKLGGDRTLPVFDSKYGNQAYTYAIYYYPYDNVKTEIVCSPRKGYERQATGHGSSFKRWIYWDGYYFLRWEKGRNVGNTKDPWTQQELAIPENLGIFNQISEKFIEDYDPRFSNSKCMVSFYD